MPKIDKGIHPIWQGFSLEIEEDISFEMGGIYRLDGPNGSGKSSFINKILLPRLLKNDKLHLIYIQQQMHMQLYALRAWAALYYPHIRVKTENDVWQLLWQDLAKLEDDKPVFVISDEAGELVIPKQENRPMCVVYSSHKYQQPEQIKLRFIPQSSSLSLLTINAETEEHTR